MDKDCKRLNLTGEITECDVNAFSGTIEKINEPWDITTRLKEYSINPVWAEGLIYNDAIPAEYGLPNLWTIISGSSDQVGVMLYERIANFVQNNRDIDVCSLRALYSIAQSFDQEEIFSYDLVYPVELERMMNIFSINPSILLTSGFVLNLPTLYSLYNYWGNQLEAIPEYGIGPSGVLSAQVTTFEDLPLLTGDRVILDYDYLNNIMEDSIKKLLISKLRYAWLPENINLNVSGTYMNIPDKMLAVHRYNVAQEYIGFLEDIIPSGELLFCPDTSGLIVCESANILRDICTRTYYHRETLKNVYQKYNMLGSTQAVERLVNELLYRSFTNYPDTWRYTDPTSESHLTSSDLFQNQYYPVLKDILGTVDVDVIEYWDKTDYMDISAASPLVCGIVGYKTEAATSAWIDISGNYLTGSYDVQVPVYGTGPFGAEIEGGRDRFWEGASRQGWIDTSEHTQEEVDMFFENLGMSAEYASEYQDYLWDTFAVSGFNRVSVYPDLTGVPAPRYANTPVSAIPADGWLVEPTYLNDMGKKYIGQITGDAPAANYRSQLYPTIAPQPFIWNFIRKLYDKYPEIIPTILYNLETEEQHFPFQLDGDGRLKDSWHYFNQEFTGYQTYYEASLNLDYNQITDPDVDRDGPFHADALDTYIVTETDMLTEAMSGHYHQVAPSYKTFLPCNIRKQLRVFQEDVKTISGISIFDHDQDLMNHIGEPYSGGLTDGYAAFNYAVDIQDNHYTLYKENDQIEGMGTPYMRFKNHPISFPISYGVEENVSSLSAATAMLVDKEVIEVGNFSTISKAGTGVVDGSHETFEYYDVIRTHDNTAVATWYTDVSGNLANPWSYSNVLRIYDYELHQMYVPYSIYNLDYILDGHTYQFAVVEDDVIVIGQDNQGQDKIVIFQSEFQDLDDLRIQKFECNVTDRERRQKAFGILTNEKNIPRTYPFKGDQVFEIKNYVGYYVHEKFIIFVYAYHIREGWADLVWIYWDTELKQFIEPSCGPEDDLHYKLHTVNYVDDKLPEEEKARMWEHVLTKIHTQDATPLTQEIVKPGDEENQKLKITTVTMSASGDLWFMDDSAYNDPITAGPILYHVPKADWMKTSVFSVPTTATRVGSTGLSGLPPIESLTFVDNRLFGMSSTNLDIYEFDINTGEASYDCTLDTVPNVEFSYAFSDWTWDKNNNEMLLMHSEPGENEIWKFNNKIPGSFAAEKLSNLNSVPYGSGAILKGLGTTLNNATFSSMPPTSGAYDEFEESMIMILGTTSITGVVDDFNKLTHDFRGMFFNKTV